MNICSIAELTAYLIYRYDERIARKYLRTENGRDVIKKNTRLLAWDDLAGDRAFCGIGDKIVTFRYTNLTIW